LLIVNFEFGEKMKKILLSLVAIATLVNAEMIRIDDKEVVLDTDTNLIWQDNSEAETVRRNWQGAIDYCQNLILAGYNDWRLPDKDTLQALYPKKDSLRNVTADFYWSSSPYVSAVLASSLAWRVGFYHGSGDWDGKSSSHLVRCVRDSKNFETLSFSSFVNLQKTNTITDKCVILASASQASKSKPFLVKKDGKNYFGIQNELLKKFGLNTVETNYSQNPFEDIQKLTQQQLNDYLTIPTIAQPILPMPLNLVKDEFETKAEFNERVYNESHKRELEIEKLQNEFRAKVEARNQELENRKANIENMKKELIFANFTNVMGRPILKNQTFDAETKTMYADISMDNANWTKKVAIKIEDRNLAKNFKLNIQNAISKVKFAYENESFVVQDINIEFENKNLVALLDNSEYKPEKVAVTIENKKVAFNELQNPNLVDKYQVSALGYSESSQAKGLKYDDDLTPIVNNLKPSNINNNKWLFAIAIEKYDEADSVTFAKNSAEAFIKTAQKRFGISDRNTYALIDDKATSASIKDRLQLMLSNVKEGDSVYFYYSGHGIPNPSDGEAYILPKDKIVDFVTKEKEFMVRNLYNQLSESKASKVIAFVDSCFSGNTDGISNIKGVAATRMKTKQVEFDKSKMVVITAGTANQFSNAFSQKGHRLFTYYLTKSIAQRPVLDLDSIYKEVSLNVKDESYKMGDLKRQTPQIEGNVGLGL
jgi:hypothetical protein